MKLTISKPIAEFTLNEFLEHVKGMRKQSMRELNSSKAVPDIQLTFAKTRTTVKLTRAKKEISLNELELLAQEYVRTQDELFELFTKRKIRILDPEGNVLNAKVRKPKSGRPRKAKRAKEDAHSDESTVRETEGGDQLIIS